MKISALVQQKYRGEGLYLAGDGAFWGVVYGSYPDRGYVD